MAFIRSFVCIIFMIAADKVRYSIARGRKGRKEMRKGGDAEGIRIEMSDKRQKERKSFFARAEHPLIPLVCTYILHAYDSHKSQTSAFIVQCVTATREDTCSRRKTPRTSHNENKRVRCRCTRLIKNRSYQFARESRSEKGEGG